MKDIMIFKDQCQAKVAYSDEGKTSDFVDGLKADLDNDVSEMSADNMKVDKIEKKDDVIEKTSFTAV